MSNIKFQFTSITPKMAKDLLGNIEINRKFKEPVVYRYAQDMREGRWKEDTGEAIKIDYNGRVIDGEHRLRAIIKSGVTIKFLIISGLNPTVFDVLDTGAARTASDVFTIAGYKNAASISSTISCYYIIKRGSQGRGQKNNRLTNAQIKLEYEKREEYWQDIFHKCTKWYTSIRTLLTKSHIGGFYSFFYDINPIDAERFFDELCLGENRSDATRILYDNLLKDKINPRKVQIETKFAWIVKSWNSWRKGQPVKMIKFDTERESFPKAI